MPTLCDAVCILRQRHSENTIDELRLPMQFANGLSLPGTLRNRFCGPIPPASMHFFCGHRLELQVMLLSGFRRFPFDLICSILALSRKASARVWLAKSLSCSARSVHVILFADSGAEQVLRIGHFQSLMYRFLLTQCMASVQQLLGDSSLPANAHCR